MRLVFAGTPRTAVPSLAALLRSRHEVAAVITRPDAPSGRGRRVGPSPVAQRAAKEGLLVLKPVSPREPGFLDQLEQLAPDCCPVTAYGALIPKAMLAVPPHGWVNLHFSLLPAWRGAAPVPHAILHGDDITGATTFSLVPELDAGPVYGVLTEPIRPTDTAGDLLARLAEAGAELLVRTLDGIESGQLTAVPQPAGGVSLAPKLTPGDARVRWDTPAHAVDRQIRACTPAPGAWTMLGDTRLKLWPVRAARPGETGNQPPASHAQNAAQAGGSPAGGLAPGGELRPGELLIAKATVFVGTGTSPVELGDVQQGGKRRMNARDWARGLHQGQGPAHRDNGAAGQPQEAGASLVLS
jgi:methionyl-tRNA formyltransferase